MQEILIGDVFVLVDTSGSIPVLVSANEGELMEFADSNGGVFYDYPLCTALDVRVLSTDKDFMRDVEECLANIACEVYEARNGI